MSKSDKELHEWEQLYTQYKNPEGDSVVCMIHKRTKKSVYFDSKLNRLLSKNEARMFKLDLTGQFAIISEGAHNPMSGS